MVSLSIPPLTSLKWPSHFKLSDKIPATSESLVTLYHQLSDKIPATSESLVTLYRQLSDKILATSESLVTLYHQLPDKIPATSESLVTLYHQLSAFLRSDSTASIISFIIYSGGTFLAITLPACIFLYSTRKKKTDEFFVPDSNFEADVNDVSSEKFTVRSIDEDEFSEEFIGEVVDAADAMYADEITTYNADYSEEIQIQETLLASLITSEISNSPSSSIHCPISNTEPTSLKREPNCSSESFCEICLENKEYWQMFTNDTCSHSFCNECTTSHILVKIQDKMEKISCPSLNCKAILNSEACRLMIPLDKLVQWDEFLCMSLIPDSQKLYCPFLDCSAMLVNDSEDFITKINCLVCKRSFCAECHVPWHSEFTCKEFKKLYHKKGGKEDKILKTLAKKKSWKKCPKCKMYVEKSEGCVHITCRCKYEFCYRCGGKWSDSHGYCQPK